LERENNRHLLVIDDEKGMCISLKQLLEDNGFVVSIANSAKEGLEILQRFSIDLIICDIVMPDMSGILFLEKIGNNIPVIMITAYASIQTARKAFKLGACDYLVKPFDFDELLVVVRQNMIIPVMKERLSTQSRFFDSKNHPYIQMIELVKKFSKTKMPILIVGESGTGKEIIAEYICELSDRNNKPFIRINCAAIPETLLESELFGYERGAFTGAYGRKIGKFEEAEGGTIFFDEIGDMPLLLQAKMLRVLQNFEIHRLGAQHPTKVDVRVITASNRDLDGLIQNGNFRIDLYHRLNGARISIPPLRERLEDIEELTSFFTKQFCNIYQKKLRKINEEVMKTFKSYSWPGNVRELRNCLERGIVVCEGDTLMLKDLPDQITRMNEYHLNTSSNETFSSERVYIYRNEYMRKLILDALKRTNGNRAETAKMLKIGRKTLYNRMKILGIKHEFK
jgi:two-component system response regulator AtoC